MKCNQIAKQIYRPVLYTSSLDNMKIVLNAYETSKNLGMPPQMCCLARTAAHRIPSQTIDYKVNNSNTV